MTQLKCPIYTLATFSKATDRRKNQIAINVLYPKTQNRSFYRKVKNTIIDSLVKGFDQNKINEGIEHVKNYPYKLAWEKGNYLLALQNFKKTHIPSVTNTIFEKNININNFELNGLSITVNPELIIKEVRNGITYIGAIKFNVSKSTQNKIDYDFCRTIVFEYLKTITKEGEKVDFNMIYFYTPLNNNWNRSNTLIHTQIIENVIDDLFFYLEKAA